MNKIIKRHHAEPGPVIVPNFVTNEEAEAILQRLQETVESPSHRIMFDPGEVYDRVFAPELVSSDDILLVSVVRVFVCLFRIRIIY